ncbi:DMT family transporter [Sphingomonas sp. LM7]|uniref:DMT family transporter n=1 Tax=Sphingomonas sp. LM7 TaxID=1938607 RepID=UPI000983F387|nr:DMT family transporter [Sphingomonas sp. LM7]AQR75059.1 EamA family transporter [Sphingomonas sp. LM7]
MTTAPASTRKWLGFALATTVLWGIWGAATGVSIERGFPETLIYVVWSLTMLLPMLVVLARSGWKLDTRGMAPILGLAIGLLGAGGQLLLFHAVKTGPAWLIFPIISLSPVVTVALSLTVLRERTSLIGWAGIVLALVALPLFDFSPQGLAGGGTWFLLALLVMLAWGLQAFVMKFANDRMSGESIFVYMTLTGLLLAPVAWMMTDWSQPVNWGWDGPWLAGAIQLLNAVGALTLVFAFRYGKAIVVAPLTNAGAPLATALISLVAAGVVPGPLKTVALVMALVAAMLLAFATEKEA